MKFGKSFKIALNIIFHSKLRSWLTILGIVIGIASIVSIVSLGAGAEQNLSQNLNSLRADVLTITSGGGRATGAGAQFRGGGGFGGGFGESGGGSTAKNLTVNDVTALRGVTNVKEVMGTVSGSVAVSYLSQSSRVNIQGVDPAIWKDFVSSELSYGRYLSQGDTNVVVVGGSVATSTFTNLQINRQITIGGKLFNVVGILKQSGGAEDNRIFMPVANAITVIDYKDSKDFDSISVQISDISLTTQTVTDITNKLLLTHQILQSSKQDFSVTSALAVQQRITSTLSSFSLFLTAIAAISLIVGAIGIMNSMFTSVLEKTREIGILKALGAKNSDILIIFLLNSAIIGLIGGLLGVLFGVVGSGFMSQLIGFSPVGRFSLSSSYVSPTLVLEAFSLSIIVGLISGAVPAYRASKLDPVEALRSE